MNVRGFFDSLCYSLHSVRLNDYSLYLLPSAVSRKINSAQAIAYYIKKAGINLLQKIFSVLVR